jgi:hypothetical protein
MKCVVEKYALVTGMEMLMKLFCKVLLKFNHFLMKLNEGI